MNHWLMKSEPDVFSIEHLREQRVAGWDGVRNYQARNFMRAMRKGDKAFFYHSSTVPPGIAGTMEIVEEAYPDPSQFDPPSDHYDPASTKDKPRWDQVDVKFLKVLRRLVPLEMVRATPALQKMALIKRPRLSVQPVTPAEWTVILRLAGEESA
jgi:predicted RNA-binding protein with PUA-like domain